MYVDIEALFMAFLQYVSGKIYDQCGCRQKVSSQNHSVKLSDLRQLNFNFDKTLTLSESADLKRILHCLSLRNI